ISAVAQALFLHTKNGSHFHGSRETHVAFERELVSHLQVYYNLPQGRIHHKSITNPSNFD
ncbi:MAG: hypothetical protein IJC24_01965, partial [Clostridia bacterium]|nr:hypothetical protein [Clostridia bacterium]